MTRALAFLSWLAALLLFLFSGFILYAVPGLSGSGRDLSMLNGWGIGAAIVALLLGVAAVYYGIVLWRR